MSLLTDAVRISSADPPLNYDSPAALRAFLEAQGLGMRKRLGQHFLINPRARGHLLDALDLSPGEGVWEIGPGLGAMTFGLLEQGLRVRAFELDSGFCQVLTQLFGDNPRFCLVPGDVLKTWPQAGDERYLLGNLPYTIGSRLVGALIEGRRFFTRMVVLLQRELVQRMIARPGSKDYSSFSVLCQSFYTMSPLSVLKGPSFYPAPHVDSQGLRLELRADVRPDSYSPLFQPLVRRLFASRRKTINHNLYDYVVSTILKTGGLEAQEFTRKALERCGIPENTRAEALDGETFAALAALLEGMKLHI